MMLNKHFYSDHSSKNSSFHKLNFPSLSHKASENQARERNLDLSLLPFYVDNQSATDCSSAGRFFRHVECQNTTRAASHSFRMPKVHKTKESFLHQPEAKPFVSSDQAWEISERIDSFKIRAENSQFLSPTSESISYQLQLWKNCSNEIISVIKGANNELANGLLTLFTKIFHIFDEQDHHHKQKHQENKEKTEELHSRMRKLQKDLLKVQQEYSEAMKFKKLDEEKIKKEVDEMFPNNDEEIKKMKEESLQYRNQVSRNVPETLEKIWANMQTDDKIPEATEIDFEQFNCGEVYLNLQENYKFVVNRTVKHVKTNLVPKVSWSLHEVQTDVPWIDPKIYDALVKQHEKLNLAFQSSQMQLEGLKEDLYNKNSLIEKVEGDKGSVKNEVLQAKRENELLTKEIQNLKLDVEMKKSEIFSTKKQSDEKTVRIVELESKVEFLSDKVLDLNYELEKTKRSRPPSAFFVKKVEKEKVLVEEKEEPKKNKLDEVTKSGLTVREEMEKLYSSSIGNKSAKKTSDNELSLSYQPQLASEENKMNKSFGASTKQELYNQAANENYKQSVNEVPKKGNRLSIDEAKNIPANLNTKINENYLKSDISQKGTEKSSLKDKVKKDTQKSEEKKKQFTISDLDNENDSEDDSQIIHEDVNVSVKKPVKSSSKQKAGAEDQPHSKDSVKKSVQRATQKINLLKSSVNTIKKSSEGKKPTNNPELKPRAAINSDPVDTITSEYLDSDGPYNRISTSKYNENSIISSDSKQNPKKTESNPERPQIKVPSVLKSNSNYKEQISSSENLVESQFEESENYENIEKSIEKLSKLGKIDPEMQKIANSSKEEFSNPIIIISGPNEPGNNKKDKCSGNDAVSQKDVGIQVNMNKRTEDPPEPATYFLPYNPNNIYGLRGDVYYQKSSFQPQSRIPDLNSSIIFTPPYKFN